MDITQLDTHMYHCSLGSSSFFIIIPTPWWELLSELLYSSVCFLLKFTLTAPSRVFLEHRGYPCRSISTFVRQKPIYIECGPSRLLLLTEKSVSVLTSYKIKNCWRYSIHLSQKCNRYLLLIRYFRAFWPDCLHTGIYIYPVVSTPAAIILGTATVSFHWQPWKELNIAI